MKEEKKLYSDGEEIFNGVTHIVGGGLGIVFLVIFIIWHENAPPLTKFIICIY